MAHGPAVSNGREVTLCLMTAAAALIIPFERLRPDARTEHPTRSREQFPELATSLDMILSENFVASRLCGHAEMWKAGTLRSVEGKPDQWPELQAPKSMSPEKQVKSVLKVIRNSLAHGNIVTKPASRIREIIFVTEQRDSHNRLITYQYIQVSPQAFLDFLTRWFGFLEQSAIPKSVAVHALDDAPQQPV